MKLLLLVLNDPARLLDLLKAWKEAGVDGATILFSTGMGRVHLSATLQDDLPLMPSLSDFYDHDESLSRTIFSIVDDELVERVTSATSQVVGDLNKPGTGILAVLPVEDVYGLIHYGNSTSS